MVTGKDFVLCIVLYNQSLSQCNTYLSLLEAIPDLTDLTLFIYDNSSKEQTADIEIQEALYPSLKYIYIHDHTNPGISKAYNEAALVAKKMGKQWLTFFDQDTLTSRKFFGSVLKCVNDFPDNKLVVPVVQSKIIISPSWFFMGRSFAKKKALYGNQSARWYSIINSGITIRRESYFEAGGYDEDFPLDFSDHYFMSCFKKKNTSFFVLDCINNHDLSTFTDTDLSRVTHRFTIYFSGAIHFSRKTKSILPLIWALLRAIKLSITYKTISFLYNAFRLLKK